MTLGHTLPATIRTERLTLRAPAMSDVPEIVAMANNPRMAETTATLPFPYTQSDGRAFVDQAATDPALKAYAIAGTDERFIGAILFKFVAGKPPEIGYWLGEPHWARGYAAEAVRGLLDAARLVAGFAEVDARVLASNPASIRVLEKTGFTIIERTHGLVERHRGKPLLVMRWRAA